MHRHTILLLAALAALQGCEKPVTEPLYAAVPITRRDITVAVEAAGLVEPSKTVELKSKASGEILEMRAETGDRVKSGELLVRIDERNPRNALAQAQAQLEAAQARRSIAKAQAERAERLLASRTINEVDYEQTQLEFANAKAEVVRSEVAVETARIQLDDTNVLAPMDGMIIERLVEKGQVISSPIMDVGGGTLLMKMADLRTVQIRTLVDETDIGKIEPGQTAEVTVTAFPNQPFTGSVEKIEPQASAEETVTTFAVQIVLDNERALLRPGMNAEVEILVARRTDVLAVPTMALRTERDIPTAAQLVGLTENAVREQLASAAPSADQAPDTAVIPGSAGYQFGRRYWVFVQENGAFIPRWVSTGLTDLEYSEVLDGLDADVEVVLLPSSGLVEAQQRFRERMRRFTGMPGMSQ